VYDPTKGKTVSKTTKLQDNANNRREVKLMAKKVQAELDKKKAEADKNYLMHGKTIGEAFDHFLRINGNKHKNTIYEYKMFFKRFSEDFDPDKACGLITKQDIESWLVKVRDNASMAQNTKYIFYKQCKHFLNFLFEQSYISPFKLNQSVAIQQARIEIITFSDKQLKVIFDNLKSEHKNFQILLYMLFYTGLRPSSLITITVDKIDMVNRTYRYWDAKLKDWAENPFHDDLYPILEQRIKKIKEGPIIKYCDSTAASKAFRRYLRKLGIFVKGINTKTFRKTFVSRAAGVIDLATVSKLVGHKNISTTDKYYNKPDLEKKRKELQKLKGIESAE